MKRHAHRKAKIKVGDQVYATTEILAHAGESTIPLGARGEVLRIKGKALDVRFDEPGIARVARGQVRLGWGPHKDETQAFVESVQASIEELCKSVETTPSPPAPSITIIETAPATLEFIKMTVEFDNSAAAQDAPSPPEPVAAPTITINGVEVPAIAAKDIEP